MPLLSLRVGSARTAGASAFNLRVEAPDAPMEQAALAADEEWSHEEAAVEEQWAHEEAKAAAEQAAMEEAGEQWAHEQAAANLCMEEALGATAEQAAVEAAGEEWAHDEQAALKQHWAHEEAKAAAEQAAVEAAGEQWAHEQAAFEDAMWEQAVDEQLEHEYEVACMDFKYANDPAAAARLALIATDDAAASEFNIHAHIRDMADEGAASWWDEDCRIGEYLSFCLSITQLRLPLPLLPRSRRSRRRLSPPLEDGSMRMSRPPLALTWEPRCGTLLH